MDNQIPTKIEQMDQKEIYTQIMIDAQKKQITTLNKKINELKVEIEELKTKLKQAEAAPSAMGRTDNKGSSKFTEEEQICKQEISKLLEISNDRELTLEETKKLDLYTKILNNRKTEEKVQEEIEKVSDADLLQFLQQSNP